MRQTGKFTVSGALAGLCNGLFGAGGGLFLVPLFTRWAGMDQRRAFATSVAVVLPLSLVSAGVYLAGAALANFLDTALLRRGFGLVLLWVGCRELFSRQAENKGPHNGASAGHPKGGTQEPNAKR